MEFSRAPVIAAFRNFTVEHLDHATMVDRGMMLDKKVFISGGKKHHPFVKFNGAEISFIRI